MEKVKNILMYYSRHTTEVILTNVLPKYRRNPPPSYLFSKTLAQQCSPL